MPFCYQGRAAWVHILYVQRLLGDDATRRTCTEEAAAISAHVGLDHAVPADYSQLQIRSADFQLFHGTQLGVGKLGARRLTHVKKPGMPFRRELNTRTPR